jgi:hypothetical protein
VIDEVLMRIAGMLAVAGFAAAICSTSEADAVQSRSATVSGGLEFSHELRRFPRPPIIVNATPKPQEKPTLTEKNVASGQEGRMARAACPVGCSQGSDPACREGQKAPPQRPAS